MTFLIPAGLGVISLIGIILVAMASRADGQRAPTSWPRKAVAGDTLAYVFGANVAFLAQEVALVATKAALPGVQSTLFHNSHDWLGDHPNLDFLQGAGLVGSALAAGIGWLVVSRSRSSSFGAIAGWWMIFHGLIALAINLASGVVDPEVEAGAWLADLGLTGSAAIIVGVLAVLAVPLVALHLGPFLAPVDGDDGATAFTIARRRILLPALLAVPLLTLFRLPAAEAAIGGILLLAVAAPWAALGAAGGPLPNAPQAPASEALENASSRLDRRWNSALLATAGSIVVAVILLPGITFG